MQFTADETECFLLQGSLLEFTRVFYKLRTGRLFEISEPEGRESHHLIIMRELVKVLNGETKRLIINVPPRYGKAIHINTPIFTKNGWKKAYDINVGDEVVGANGWTKVLGVFPQGILNAKEVIFNDNQSVICNDEHLWSVCDRYTPTYKTLTTYQIQKTLYEADGRKHWRIPIVNGEYGDLEPFIDPYLFGCWLGDGHSHYAAITTMDEDIVKAFEEKGHTMRLHTHQSAGRAKTYGIVGNRLSRCLKENNLLKNKHIPDCVFLWSKENRIALLQGLMDTDGTCGKNGQVAFTNTNKNIITGICKLINSIGGIYKIYIVREGYAQTINMRLPDEIKCFRLERKQCRVSKGVKCSPRRFISNIVESTPCEMVCFKVDAPNSLFAVGEGLILTHNTELLIHMISWAMANYPDSNFIYVSYSHSLAKKQTQTIKQIMELPQYRKLFGIDLSDSTQAKDNFETKQGGSVYAVGCGGTITGRGAGIQGVSRFGGMICLDDLLKPDEATSDTVRDSLNEWYFNTLQSRLNSPDTPIVYIGQRLHEDELVARLIATGDWKTVIIPALDVSGNALNPKMHTRNDLLKLKEQSPYTYASQYNQNPIPAGGGIFRREWFPVLEEEPKILTTFITADTAETEKSYNDATVFAFWGLYKLDFRGAEIDDMYALHLIDCAEIRVDPADLESEFMAFWSGAMRHKIKPKHVAIEKKSTGVTLCSVLGRVQGLRIVEIERSGARDNKTQRFLNIQPYIASKQLTLPFGAKHTKMFIDHMVKITANNSHRFDDICDVTADAIKAALIDKTMINLAAQPSNYAAIAAEYAKQSRTKENLKQQLYGR